MSMALCGFEFHQQALPPSSEQLATAWAPYLQTPIELFGAERCMFESNFPVDKAMCSYAVLWNAFKRIAAGASAHEKSWLFKGTANQFYKLGLA
jgi:predicted TIM-barrel fold metal-dependent hydrolase